ncbi:hypothetical protein QO012_003006 [Methylobacterium aerolatum]|uniref:Uncharacterized protein n=1 Tax=Methylobacterium aerolatum TaxID=418708 RepID=A0ABU0I324_9HYPH|nr:hypothetical protein [Methylobacterium aerolatum]GJD34578.1 hypothetical protein FMGBMHLM_1480 [Methylobacterium aerolatum]
MIATEDVPIPPDVAVTAPAPSAPSRDRRPMPRHREDNRSAAMMRRRRPSVSSPRRPTAFPAWEKRRRRVISRSSWCVVMVAPSGCRAVCPCAEIFLGRGRLSCPAAPPPPVGHCVGRRSAPCSAALASSRRAVIKPLPAHRLVPTCAEAPAWTGARALAPPPERLLRRPDERSEAIPGAAPFESSAALDRLATPPPTRRRSAPNPNRKSPQRGFRPLQKIRSPVRSSASYLPNDSVVLRWTHRYRNFLLLYM